MAESEEHPIEEIAISEFKAKCLLLLDRVNKTKKPLRVTRRGRPIADVVAPAEETTVHDWIGSMSGTIRIIGDIVSPVIDVEDIETMRD